MIESLTVSRKECYDDIIMSLVQGLLVKDDINVIIQHYEDLEHSEKEVPTVGMINGYCFRAKADILGDGYIVDLKTCRNLKGFKWDARDYGYAAQVYIYTELFDIDYTNWTFIAVDRNTGDFGFYTISEDFYLSGKQIVMEGISNYKLIEKGQTEFEPRYIEEVL